ncbi:MAG: tyrosine-type recombinase/integrase [Pseudomonadota bacterium]
MGDRIPERKRIALTVRFIETVAVPGKYHDGRGLGLYLRVLTGGSRQWVQRIMVSGRRAEIGLGSPPVVTLAMAREAALANKRLARDGRDPVAEKRAERDALSFADAARKAHSELAPTFRNPKDAKAFLAALEAHAFPRFGDRKAADVTSAETRQAVLAIRTTTPEAARKLALRISAVFKWCIAEGVRSDNPATAEALALPRREKTLRHRKALPHGEMAACLASVRASGAWSATKLALEFVVLTAARSGEARAARWSAIDLEAGLWQVPAERMKMKRPHRVPLSDRAAEVLGEAATLEDGSGLVFPSHRGRPLSDMTLSKLVKSLGFDADVHGFRTSFRTWAQECTDHPREVAEAALAHAVGDIVERSYARSDAFERRRALMQEWADYLVRCDTIIVPMNATR